MRYDRYYFKIDKIIFDLLNKNIFCMVNNNYVNIILTYVTLSSIMVTLLRPHL